MKAFHLTISSPDGNIFDGDIYKLDVRGVEGELAIMAGHIPFVTSIKSAPIRVWLNDDTPKEAYSDGGLLTVDKNGAVLISGSFKFITKS
ncbi:MAG: F0F1 ATP synthase subunit epsilon [Clostridia bacterium]|nr:F0F1 ATP synthase subunit epsilon [Clostridia bacterium]